MKNDTRYHMSWASRFRFLVRLLGITAVLVACGGAFYLSTLLPNWKLETLASAVKGEIGTPAMIGALVLFGGALVALFAFLVEVLTSLTSGASSRGAAGINATLQVVLALGILGAVNVYAFKYELDFDLTRTKEFTLPPDIVAELRELKSETTIVVLQQHQTFGRLSEKPDKFDYAAERKVVEKVQDVVELFRKVGPQFKVVVLDVEEQGYDKNLKEVTENRPALSEAIRTAPENSIFFYSDGHVQRMSFNEFYLLDTTDSKKGDGNLVLLPQGIDAFVKRIVAVQEKRPKIALLSMHQVLSSEAGEGQAVLSLAGMKKSLEENGFKVVDLILKQNYRPSDEYDGDPAASELDENRLQNAEEDFADNESSIRVDKEYLKQMLEIQKRFDAVKDKSPKERNKFYRESAKALSLQMPNRELTEREEEFYIGVLRQKVDQAKQDLADSQQKHDELEPTLKKLRQQERAIEDRRLVDVKAKLTRLLDDCDLVVIPRITIRDAPNNERIPYGVQKMKDVHIEVLKEFVKAGKPMMVCTGPFNTDKGEPEPPPIFDELEQMLKDRGIELGNQTILFDSERKGFTARSAGNLLGGSDVPPVSFEPPAQLTGKPLNPLGKIMLALQRSVDAKLSIKLRAPRPVYVSEDLQQSLPYLGEFMWTSPNCWNEKYPFAEFRTLRTPEGIVVEPKYIPRFDPNAENKSGNPRDRVRRGPFPIGVAIESQAPDSWYDAPKKNPFDFDKDPLGFLKEMDKDKKDRTESQPTGPHRLSRLVVIGQGGCFVGIKLEPATERLLVNACNWLLVREDRLAKSIERPWRYPRLEMTPEIKQVWHWGTFVGLPGLFVYLGLIVLMIRRIR